jgi:hypothetical protein
MVLNSRRSKRLRRVGRGRCWCAPYPDNWNMFRLRRSSGVLRKKLGLTLLRISTAFGVTLFLLEVFHAPQWTLVLSVIAFPTTWLVVASIVSCRVHQRERESDEDD